jgi:hypothetical protein
MTSAFKKTPSMREGGKWPIIIYTSSLFLNRDTKATPMNEIERILAKSEYSPLKNVPIPNAMTAIAK